MTQLNATADLLRQRHERARGGRTGSSSSDAIPPFIGPRGLRSTGVAQRPLSNPISDSYHPNPTGHKLGYEPLVRSVFG